MSNRADVIWFLVTLALIVVGTVLVEIRDSRGKLNANLQPVQGSRSTNQPYVR